MPGAAFGSAVTEGQAVVARARGAAALALSSSSRGGRGETSSSSLSSNSGGGRVERVMEEVVAWLTSSGSGSRRLGDGHRLRWVGENVGMGGGTLTCVCGGVNE